MTKTNNPNSDFNKKDLIHPQYFLIDAETKVKVINSEAIRRLNQLNIKK